MASPFFTWVTQTAEWPVIQANLTLMAQERHPIESIWRIWIVVGMCGLQSITNGQYEATRALSQSMMFVILPQTLKAVIPVNINQLDTTLVALVGIGRATLDNPDWLGTHCEVCFFIGSLGHELHAVPRQPRVGIIPQHRQSQPESAPVRRTPGHSSMVDHPDTGHETQNHNCLTSPHPHLIRS